MFERIRDFFSGLVKRSAPSWVYRQPTPNILFPVQSGAVVNEDTAVSWSAIWRGLSLIGSAIGSMPATIQRRDANGNVTTLDRHPLHGMLSMEPNPLVSAFDFYAAIIYQVIMRGNAVVVINRRGTGGAANRPDHLTLVKWDDVHNMKEETDADGRPAMMYFIKGYDQPLRHDQVIHIKGLSTDGVTGLDTLKWNRETFGLALSTKRAAAAYHKNGTHSDGFLTTDASIDPQRAADIGKAWNSKTRAGETPLLTGGVRWEKIGISPKDLQLLEVRQFNVYEAARIIGVSPHLLFALDRANFSNIETLSLEFAKYTLRFWVERIEQEFSRKLFRGREIGRVRLSLNMDAFLRGDTESRAKYIEGLIDRGVISIDEARRMEGYNTLEDEAGNVHMVPLNFQTLEQMKEGASRDPQPNDTPEPNENTDETPIPNGRLNGQYIVHN